VKIVYLPLKKMGYKEGEEMNDSTEALLVTALIFFIFLVIKISIDGIKITIKKR